jgi:hypothetical protein
MKEKILAVGLVGLLAVACGTETTVIKGAPAPEPTTATDPTETPDAATEPAGDPCACPATCKSETEPDKTAVCKPAPAPEDVPSATYGKFQITGFEYWQWVKGEHVYDGGASVAWGYAGEGEPQARPPVLPTKQSQACMAEANKVLTDILKNDVPPELEAFRAKHGVKAFWQWNNDMTGTKAGVEAPDNYQSLWLYDSRLIKWISHTNRDGTCRLPTRADVVKFAKGCMTAFPNCYNSDF